MHLQKNPNVRILLEDVHPDPVDVERNSGLRKPCNSFAEHRIVRTIEVVPSVPEDILNEPPRGNTSLKVLLPSANRRILSKIPTLSSLGGVDGKAESLRETMRSSQVMSSVAEALELLVPRVLAAISASLLKGRVTMKLPGGFDIRVAALAEHRLHLEFVRLPSDDPQVRLAQVGVEDGESGIGHEDGSDVWQDEAGLVIISTFRDILKVGAAPKGILRR